MYGVDALGAEGTLDNNFRLRKRRACATYGNRAAKWTATELSETLYFNTMWTWHTDKGLPEGQYSKHIYLGETRVVTKQTSKLEVSYGQSDEWHHQYYYHPDHLGSAQLITDYEGNEYQRIEYTPYGELWVEKKTEKEEGLRYLPYKFTAKEQDEETGLYYYGARYLDAKYSRWLSADPAVGEYIPLAPVNDEAKKHNQNMPGMGGVFNVVNFQLYHYAGNNPVKYVDPDGRSDTVIISPGHGMDKEGEDRGAVVDGISEVSIIYKFCLKLYSDLKKIGIDYINLKQVIEDMTKDHSPQGRIDAANKIDAEIDASLELAIHADANTKGYTGITLYYIGGKDKSKRIAEYFSDILNAANLPTRIKPDTDTRVKSLGELRRTTAPALLIEIGSMDTKESREIMMDRTNKLSEVLANAIKSFNKDRPNWE